MLFVLTLTAIIETSLMAWSEPLFIVLILLSIVLLRQWLFRENLATLMAMAATVSLGCLTRYIGVVLLVAVGGSILLFARSDPGTRVRRTVLFVVIAAAPLGLWLVRNLLVAGTIFGVRQGSQTSLLTNSDLALHTFLSWYFPSQVVNHLALLVPLAGICGFIAALTYRSVASRPLRWSLAWRQHIGTLGLFVTIYVSFLIITSTTTGYDEIGDRLLAPIFVPTTALLLSFFQSQIHYLQKRFSRLVISAVVILCNRSFSCSRHGHGGHVPWRIFPGWRNGLW